MVKSTYSLMIRTLLCVVDSLSTVIAILLATYLRHNVFDSSIYTLIVILTWIGVSIHYLKTFENNFIERSTLKELQSVILFELLQLIVLIIFAYFTHLSSELSRLMIVYYMMMSIPICLLFRCIAKVVIHATYHRVNVRTETLLITDENRVDELLDNFNPGITRHINGVLEVKDNGIAYGTVNRKYLETSLELITKSLVTHAFDEVVLWLPDEDSNDILHIIEGFEDMGITCHSILDLPNIGGKTPEIRECGSYQVVTYLVTKHRKIDLALKRLIDIVGSIIGLIFCGLLFVILGPMIKLDSKGPIIYTSTRIGKNGRPFKFYKFRSMCSDADAKKKELMKQNEVNSTLMFKMEDDPRITKIGKFIRKTSLDEFPQFWNVLKGDMSLVGTRPPTLEEYAQYSEYYRRRLSMTPGITGMWQVSGRSDIKDFDEVVKLDLKYIDNWSPELDIRILFKTITEIFKHDGAR